MNVGHLPPPRQMPSYKLNIPFPTNLDLIDYFDCSSLSPINQYSFVDVINSWRNPFGGDGYDWMPYRPSSFVQFIASLSIKKEKTVLHRLSHLIYAVQISAWSRRHFISALLNKLMLWQLCEIFIYYQSFRNVVFTSQFTRANLSFFLHTLHSRDFLVLTSSL